MCHSHSILQHSWWHLRIHDNPLQEQHGLSALSATPSSGTGQHSLGVLLLQDMATRALDSQLLVLLPGL